MTIKSKKALEPKSLKLEAFAGFSIVETIVAIAILSFALVGPMALAQRGLNAAAYARDQVAAFYLAQEGIEYVRSVRDTNNLNGRSGPSGQWLSGLSPCIVGGSNPNNQRCGVDITAASVADCTGNAISSCRVTFNTDPQSGIYGIAAAHPAGGTWQATIYTRTVQITPVAIGGDSNWEAKVTSTVSWQSGLIPRTMTLTEEIFNWYPVAP